MNSINLIHGLLWCKLPLPVKNHMHLSSVACTQMPFYDHCTGESGLSGSLP